MALISAYWSKLTRKRRRCPESRRGHAKYPGIRAHPGPSRGSENASARLPFGLVQPGARAALQLLLAQDTGQFVTRQSSAQDAFPADEKQTYRCKCARERQAQCEQVTLTHGAPYLETLGVVVRKETQGL
ncbi:hypothetical protein WJ969_00585 [Achromobacter xylosoxidans]